MPISWKRTSNKYGIHRFSLVGMNPRQIIVMGKYEHYWISPWISPKRDRETETKRTIHQTVWLRKWVVQRGIWSLDSQLEILQSKLFRQLELKPKPRVSYSQSYASTRSGNSMLFKRVRRNVHVCVCVWVLVGFHRPNKKHTITILGCRITTSLCAPFWSC